MKTATSSSLWDYEHTGEPVPEVGELSMILDGRGAPRGYANDMPVVCERFRVLYPVPG